MRHIPAVEILRRVWLQHLFHEEDQQVHWRRSGHLPPAAGHLSTPYDPEARFNRQRDTTWVGELTETCDTEGPMLVTEVQTTPATTQDVELVGPIQQALVQRQLVPSIHLGDLGSMSGEAIVESRSPGVDRIGPMRGDPSWQGHEARGFTAAAFVVDWDAHRVL